MPNWHYSGVHYEYGYDSSQTRCAVCSVVEPIQGCANPARKKPRTQAYGDSNLAQGDHLGSALVRGGKLSAGIGLYTAATRTVPRYSCSDSGQAQRSRWIG